MKRVIALIVAFVATALPLISAQAYRYDFSGTIEESSYPTSLPTGTLFSGHITVDWDLLTEITFFNDAASSIQATITGGDLTVGGYDYDFIVASAGFSFQIYFGPADPDLRFDGFRDTGDSGLTLPGATEPFSYVSGGEIPQSLVLGEFLAGGTLVIAAVDQDTWESASATGSIALTSATAIPEPSAAGALAGILAAMIAVGVRDRRRA